MQGNSIQLNNDWDISLDEFGNLQTCKGDHAICQDVACALRLFTKDSYFEPQKGVPYFDIVLGVKPFQALVRSELNRAAKSVPGVTDAALIDFESKDRMLLASMICLTANNNQREIKVTIEQPNEAKYD